MVHFILVALVAGAVVNKLLNKKFPKAKAEWFSAFLLGALGYLPGSLMSFGLGIHANIFSDIALTTAGSFVVMLAYAFISARKSQLAKQ